MVYVRVWDGSTWGLGWHRPGGTPLFRFDSQGLEELDDGGLFVVRKGLECSSCALRFAAVGQDGLGD